VTQLDVVGHFVQRCGSRERLLKHSVNHEYMFSSSLRCYARDRRKRRLL